MRPVQALPRGRLRPSHWDTIGPGWMPFFDNLRLYLTHFAGQEATHLSEIITAETRLKDLANLDHWSRG